MKINPGIGAGEIEFGFTIDEVVNILGKAQRLEESESIEGSGYWSRDLYYDGGALDFSFRSEDDYKLGVITVEARGYTLFGRDLIGFNDKTVKTFLLKHTQEIPKVDILSEELMPDCYYLVYENTGLILWFEDDVLIRIICTPC